MTKYVLNVRLNQTFNPWKTSEDSSYNVTAKLKVNTMGELQIKFSENMRTYAIEYYNQTNIDLYIKPQPRDDTSNLNFTWEA